MSKKEPEMRLEIVKISPAQAREWLAVSPERTQRTLNKRNVAKILHAIEAGEWQLTHQPIALDETGFVLDGRHRLSAIAGQRKHVTSYVAFGADPDTYKVIDTGRSRSPGDALRIAGYTDVNVLAAATRQVLAYPEVVGTSSTLGSVSATLTTVEIMNALENGELGQSIQESARAGHQISHGIGRYGVRTSATALMSVIAIYSKYSPEIAEEFALRLGDGVNLDAVSPIRAFRQWLMQESIIKSVGGATNYKSISGTWRPTVFMANGIRCWNDYAQGNERKQVRYRPGTDLMPEVV